MSARNTSSYRKSVAAALALGAVLFASGAAFAQSCNEDFQRLSQRRMTSMAALNAIGKRGKGKMDPIAACPAARSLVAIENQMLAYMSKNKDWCQIPDNVIGSFRANHAKTANFASQACAFAGKVRKMQEMQKTQAAAAAAAAAPKLPTGPL